MRVVVLGSGAREHALGWKIQQSPSCSALYMIPGNGGTENYGVNVHLSLHDHKAIRKFCKTHAIDYLVVGPEVPLVEGLVDFLEQSMSNLYIIGPRAAEARLEGSKRYAKEFMIQHQIPTPRAKAFSREETEKALAYLETTSLPHVLKADGLASGKGVIISEDLEQSRKYVRAMLEEQLFGKASSCILIEEYLSGVECSAFALCEGTDYVLLPMAKDYKRVGEGDIGPNTGGMGAISPVPFIDHRLTKDIEQIFQKTLQGIAETGGRYKGFLFLGCIVSQKKLYVLEYNVRLGDPEAQVVLPRIGGDLLEIFEKMRQKKLNRSPIPIQAEAAAALTLASKGYPGRYEKGLHIEGLDHTLQENTWIFHAGTQTEQSQTYTKSGRVLSVAATADHSSEAIQKVYQAAQEIHWPGMFYRKDLGKDLCID